MYYSNEACLYAGGWIVRSRPARPYVRTYGRNGRRRTTTPAHREAPHLAVRQSPLGDSLGLRMPAQCLLPGFNDVDSCGCEDGKSCQHSGCKVHVSGGGSTGSDPTPAQQFVACYLLRLPIRESGTGGGRKMVMQLLAGRARRGACMSRCL